MAEDEPKITPPEHNGRVTIQTIALVVIAGILVITAVTYLGPVFKPFLVAVFLFFLARSLANTLDRQFPPWLTYIGLFLVFTGIGAIVLLFLSIQVSQLGKELGQPVYQSGIVNLINKQLAPTGYSLGDINIPTDAVFGYVFNGGMETLELLGLAFFYFLFMILGADKFGRRLHRTVPVEYAGQVFQIGEEITRGMEEFIKVKTFVGFGMAISAAAILLLFGVKYWLLWAFLFFLLNYIHYIGSMVALLPPIAMAFLDFDSSAGGVPKFHDPIWASFVAALLVLNRFVWIDFVEIRMSGERLNIEPVLIFLWLTYWGWFWGVVGLILAYPMLASLRIILEHFTETKNWALLMSEE